MKRHMSSIHENRKAFKCEICDYSCFLKGNMKRHMVTIHEEKKAFKCK